jgi:hypothetical protein
LITQTNAISLDQNVAVSSKILSFNQSMTTISKVIQVIQAFKRLSVLSPNVRLSSLFDNQNANKVQHIALPISIQMNSC